MELPAVSLRAFRGGRSRCVWHCAQSQMQEERPRAGNKENRRGQGRCQVEAKEGRPQGSTGSQEAQ